MLIRSGQHVPGGWILDDHVELATWPDGAWFGTPVQRERSPGRVTIRSVDPELGLTTALFGSYAGLALSSMRMGKPQLRTSAISRVEFGRWRWFLSLALPPNCAVLGPSRWTTRNGMYLEGAEEVPGDLHLDAELYHLLGELHPVWLAGDRFDDWVESIRLEGG